MRNVNLDREPISSEEIATFKDFKSILRNHAQTTEDLAKISSNNNKFYWIGAGVVGALGIVSLFFLGGGEEIQNVEQNAAPGVEQHEKAVSPQEQKTVVVPAEPKKSIEWQVMLNSSGDPIHDHFDFESITAERIKFAQLENVNEIKELIPEITEADAKFVSNKKVFKLTRSSEMEINPDKNLFQLVEGNWEKVSHKPIQLPELTAPRKAAPGRYFTTFHAKGFGEEFAEFEGVYWQSVDATNDFTKEDAEKFWTDGSIVESNVEGVYNITLIDGDIVKKFTCYQVMMKHAYNAAMKDYNAALIKQQEKLKTAKKTFDLEVGIYTIE